MEEPPLSPLPEQGHQTERFKWPNTDYARDKINVIDKLFHDRLKTVLSGDNGEDQTFLVLRDDIICIPQREIDWNRFRSLAAFMADELLRYGAISSDQYVSIYALDGAVAGKTRSDVGMSNEALVYRLENINHHSSDDEAGTPSTAKQIWEKIKNGTIKHDPKEHRRILVDDPDPDVQLSVYLLGHADELLSDPAKKERMENFVALQDQLDVNAGICTVDFADPEQEELFRCNAASFKHYFDARKSNKLLTKDGNSMVDIIGDGVKNIHAYVTQTPEAKDAADAIAIDTHYAEIASEEREWIIIDESHSGTFARLALSNKYPVVISRRQHETEGNAYSIVRNLSVQMQNKNLLTQLAPRLNAAERLKRPVQDEVWGGRSNVIGSFRNNLSRLSWEELVVCLKECSIL